jgi:hypothetical protein
MMMRKRLASIFALDATEESAGTGKESSNQLRTPTLDERATLYLRSVHEKHDFTKEEYSRARELMLDAMAADITAKLQVPEELTLQDRSEYAMPEESWPALSTSLFAADRLFAAEIHCAPPLEGSVAAAAAALRMSKSAPSRRRVGTFWSSGFAAGVALVLVAVVPVFWFVTDQNSTESRVAVQPSPHESFGKWANIAGSKQVETTAAPLGVNPRLLEKDELIRRAVPTDRVDPVEMANLLKRGRELIAAGDIPAARSVLKLAAEAGDASAALELGGTYDPVVLERLKAQTQSPATPIGPNSVGDSNLAVAADIAMARAWYQRAKELGLAEASNRLERLVEANR